MGTVIAVCGKGGTGKTTLSSLLIRGLSKAGDVPILAVDADPNANLGPAIGITPEQTVGQVLEEFHGKKLTIPQGMTKAAFLELRLNQALAETKGIDFLAMGRPEGPGCYCSANSILRDVLDRLVGNYKFVVIDNEAGMEHLSRRTAGRIDDLIMVSDSSMKGVRTIKGLFELVAELQLPIVRKYAVISRAEKLDSRLDEAVKELPVPLLGMIPDDEKVVDFDLDMKPFTELPDDSKAVAAADAILAQMKEDAEKHA